MAKTSKYMTYFRNLSKNGLNKFIISELASSSFQLKSVVILVNNKDF